MVSLTTVYLVSIVLTSIAGFGSVFASKKIVGGAIVMPVIETPLPEPINEVPQDQTDKLSNAIQTGFGMDEEFAKSVIDFIKTPVTNWNTIATDQSSLREKFRKTLTHPNLNKCPESLLKICKLVSDKYSNMKDFIEGNGYQNLGDQTQEAISLLPSTA